MLTHDPVTAESITPDRASSRGMASAEPVLRLIRRKRRNAILVGLVGLSTAPPVGAGQPSEGRELLARAVRRLSYRSRAAAVLVDACGIPAADVAVALGWGQRGVARSLRRGRRALTAAIALQPSEGAAFDSVLGAALRGLHPDVATARNLAPRRSSDRAQIPSGLVATLQR
jgi:hypothetical protein